MRRRRDTLGDEIRATRDDLQVSQAIRLLDGHDGGAEFPREHRERFALPNSVRHETLGDALLDDSPVREEGQSTTPKLLGDGIEESNVQMSVMPVNVADDRAGLRRVELEDPIEPGWVLPDSKGVFFQKSLDRVVHKDVLDLSLGKEGSHERPTSRGVEIRRGGPLVPDALAVEVEVADVNVASGLMASVRTERSALSRAEVTYLNRWSVGVGLVDLLQRAGQKGHRLGGGPVRRAVDDVPVGRRGHLNRVHEAARRGRAERQRAERRELGPNSLLQLVFGPRQPGIGRWRRVRPLVVRGLRLAVVDSTIFVGGLRFAGNFLFVCGLARVFVPGRTLRRVCRRRKFRRLEGAKYPKRGFVDASWPEGEIAGDRRNRRELEGGRRRRARGPATCESEDRDRHPESHRLDPTPNAVRIGEGGSAWLHRNDLDFESKGHARVRMTRVHVDLTLIEATDVEVDGEPIGGFRLKLHPDAQRRICRERSTRDRLRSGAAAFLTERILGCERHFQRFSCAASRERALETPHDRTGAVHVALGFGARPVEVASGRVTERVSELDSATGLDRGVHFGHREGRSHVSDELQGLFQEAREASTPRTWSKGIELQRADAVDAISSQDPVELRVRVPGRTVALQVTLHLADAEWSCTCDSDDDPCEHVVAAILAMRQASRDGRALSLSSKAGADVGYRLSRDGERVVVARVAVRGADETPIEVSLASLISGRQAGPTIEPTAVDLTIDQFLQQNRVRSLPPERFAAMLPLLAQAKDVRLEGRPVRVAEAPLWPKVSVLGARRAYALRFERPDRAIEVVVPGLLLVDGESLAQIGAPEVTGARLERLPVEQRFEGPAVAELLTRILPAWRERTEVTEQVELPQVHTDLRARPLVDVVQRGSKLHVVASVGYGEPPVARLIGDRLEGLRGAVIPVIERNAAEERSVVEQLRKSFDLVPGKAVEVSGREAITLASRLRAATGITVFGDAHERCYPSALDAQIRLDEGGSLGVTFTGTGEGEVREADGRVVLEAWRDGLDSVPLLEGGWAPLPLDWLQQHGHRVIELLAARDESGKVARYAAPALARLCADLDHPMPAELAGLEPLAREFDGLPEARLPDDLNAELRPYQKRGADWLSFLRRAGLGALLADDMGLGKTLQTICVIDGRTLIVCPKSVVHNWIAELQRFRPSLSASIYHGADREVPEHGVVVTTYALLRRDSEKLAAIDWHAVVLDEAQAIKNPDSQVAEAAFQMRASFRIALSGTPVENRLEELWSLMHFCNPGLLDGRRAFRETFERPIADGDPGAAKRLRDRIRPFLLRRTKAAVAKELPPRIDSVLVCELESDERAVYDAVLASTRASVLAELERGGNVMKALEALLRLRQAACDVALVPGQPPRTEPSSKIQRLLVALEDAATDGHKALVFSQWTSLLDRVQVELERAAIGFVRLDGATRDRKAVVDEFQDDGGPPVMLLSLKAGGTGLNLTAADHVFLLDPWWNPAAEDQAADRAHRIGQSRSVLVHRLIAKDTVEERILELQAKKRGLAEAALDEAASAAALTRDDLLALFA